MKKTTSKKKSLNELQNVGQLKKEEMKDYFGAEKKQLGRKNRKMFFGLFSPDPCEGDMPQ